MDNVLEGMQQIKTSSAGCCNITKQKGQAERLARLVCSAKIEITAAVDSVVAPAAPAAEDRIEQKLQEEVGELKQLVKSWLRASKNSILKGRALLPTGCSG